MNPEPRSDRPLRVVLDTNVIVSGLNFPGRNEDRVVQLGIEGEVQVYLSAFILDEVDRVLRTKFGWSNGEAERASRNMQQWAVIVEPTRIVDAVNTDENDNPILECCLESQADYLVTGDRRDLLPLGQFQGSIIVNAGDFLRALGRVS